MSQCVMRQDRTISNVVPESTQNDIFQNKQDSRQVSVSTGSEIKEERPTIPAVDAYRFVPLIKSVSFFAASLYSTILEDTVSQLRCLDELNTELRIIKTMVDLDTLRAVKFGVEQPAVTDELEGVDPKNLKQEPYKLVKLANDRKMVCETLLQLYKELGLKWNYSSLHDCLKKARVLIEYRERLQIDNAKFKITCKELSKQIRHQRNNIKSTYYDTDVIIEYLKTQVEDLVLEEECRNRVAASWQNARAEQHLEEIRLKELQPSKSLQHYKTKSDDEQRVHAEIDMLGFIKINEKAEEVENWMNKYDDDMEAVDLKIEVQKNEFNVAQEQRKELELIIKTHAELMVNWIKFKEDREATRKYEERMNRAAIVLQAWWRGLLVRKALGPYKVKKRPVAKKGKK